MKQHFDCIVAGGGCAGLSLAYHLVEQGYTGDILILDREKKSNNDRTWCWWRKSATPFDALFTHEWSSLGFADRKGTLFSTISPYHYVLLRSADFYHFMYGRLGQCDNVYFLQASIDSIEDRPQGAVVIADQLHYSANWVFSSIPTTASISNSTSASPLLQHFMGWWIETDQDEFDPQAAMLMDFRVAQQSAGRFVYVLPVTRRRALVEYTVFSPSTWRKTAYQQELQQYIKEVLGINEYQVIETEYGVIPMQLADNQLAEKAKHIVSIGTVGGAVKASTGYAFSRIQEQTRQIAWQLVNHQRPDATLPRSKRFAFYDRLLLQILSQRGGLASGIFSSLFRKVPFPLILKFMDEKTWIWEELFVLASLPPLPFLQVLLEGPKKIDPHFSNQPKPIGS